MRISSDLLCPQLFIEDLTASFLPYANKRYFFGKKEFNPAFNQEVPVYVCVYMFD